MFPESPHLAAAAAWPQWQSGGQEEASMRMGDQQRADTEDSSASKSSIQRFVITEKAPTRAFSWLKAATTAFTFKTLLRHNAKRALTTRSLNVKLGSRHNYHKGRAAIRHYALVATQRGLTLGALVIILHMGNWQQAVQGSLSSLRSFFSLIWKCHTSYIIPVDDSSSVYYWKLVILSLILHTIHT